MSNRSEVNENQLILGEGWSTEYEITWPSYPDYEEPNRNLTLYLKSLASFVGSLIVVVVTIAFGASIIHGILYLLLHIGFGVSKDIVKAIVNWPTVGFLIFGLVAAVSVASVVLKNPAEEARKKWQDAKSENDRARLELTTQCSNILSRIRELQQRLPTLLDAAAQPVNAARQEYDQKAFEVMFNRAESAYRYLETFDAGIREMQAMVREYNRLLAPYKHTFPPVYPPPPELLKGANLVSSSLSHVVRQGETNPRCTSIWLQIRQIEVLRSGFASLTDAFSSFGEKLSTAINDLSSEMGQGLGELVAMTSHGLSQVADQQAKTRGAINSWGMVNLVELERIRRRIDQR